MFTSFNSRGNSLDWSPSRYADVSLAPPIDGAMYQCTSPTRRSFNKAVATVPALTINVMEPLSQSPEALLEFIGRTGLPDLCTKRPYLGVPRYLLPFSVQSGEVEGLNQS